jgi:hypothetical protein
MTAAVRSVVTSGDIYVRYAIYSLSDFSLVAETEYGVVEAQGVSSPEWQTLAFPDPKPVLEADGEYILAVSGIDDPYGVYVAFDCDEFEVGVEQYYEFSSGLDFPEELDASFNGEIYSIYCTVMPAAPTQQYYLTVSSGGNGTTTPSPSVYQYDENTQVQVTAEPDSGYLFDMWLLDGAPYTQNPTATLTMTGNHALQALFTAPDYYWVSSIDSYDGPVSDPGNLTGYENDGAFAVLQGNATQQQFGEVVGVFNAGATGRIYAYGYRCEGWDGQLGVYVSADGEDWNYVSSQNINNTSPDWIDCGASASPFSYVLLTTEDSEMTSCVHLDCVRVNLPVYNFTLTVSSGGNGTTDPAPGEHQYLENTLANVTADPDGGYFFDYWLLDGNSSTQNPISVVMYGNRTLQAVFREAMHYDLTILTGDGEDGYTDPSAGTYEDILEGTPVEVTANANTGFLFDHWLLDGSPSTQNPISVTMDSNHVLQAFFHEDPAYEWLYVEAYATDFQYEDEVYPDIYIQEYQPYFDDYYGTLPVFVRVPPATHYIEVDEYVWSDYFQQECYVYCIYGEEQGPWYCQNWANIDIYEDTWLIVLYIAC